MFKLLSTINNKDNALLRSDKNLSLLKALRLVSSDRNYSFPRHRVFDSLETLFLDYLESPSVTQSSKNLLSCILALQFSLKSLFDYFSSPSNSCSYQALILSYQFGDILSNANFPWRSFLCQYSEELKNTLLFKYLKSRYLSFCLQLIDHPFYPTQEFLEISRQELLNRPIDFSLYFTISFGHLTEVLASCGIYSSLCLHNSDKSKSEYLKPSVQLFAPYSVNNLILESLEISQLVSITDINNVNIDFALFSSFSSNLEVLALSTLRLKASEFGIASDLLNPSVPSPTLDRYSLSKSLTSSLGNGLIKKPKHTFYHSRTQQYKHQSHMAYRCSDRNLLINALFSSNYSNIYPYPDGSTNYALSQRDRFNPSAATVENLQLMTFLCSSQFIGTNSGPGHLSPVFGVDTLLTNATSLASCPIYNNYCLISLKRIYNFRPQHFDFSISNFLKVLLSDWGNTLFSSSLEVRQLSSIEIKHELDSFAMFKRLNDHTLWPFTLKKLLQANKFDFDFFGVVNLTESSYIHLNLLLSYLHNV